MQRTRAPCPHAGQRRALVRTLSGLCARNLKYCGRNVHGRLAGRALAAARVAGRAHLRSDWLLKQCQLPVNTSALGCLHAHALSIGACWPAGMQIEAHRMWVAGVLSMHCM